MERILISACLLGERVRYHGGDARCEHPTLRRWEDEGRLVPLCPEVTGGLATPRPAAEITVTPEGRRVLTAAGTDVTRAFERGADAAAHACAAHGIRIAILKDGSPSCGSRSIHDGSFSGHRLNGQKGGSRRLASRRMASPSSEEEIDSAADYLKDTLGTTSAQAPGSRPALGSGSCDLTRPPQGPRPRSLKAARDRPEEERERSGRRRRPQLEARALAGCRDESTRTARTTRTATAGDSRHDRKLGRRIAGRHTS